MIKCQTVREILKANNIKLNISEADLNLDFVGNFKFSHTTMEQKADEINPPDEFALRYFFYSGNDRLLIIHDDPDYIINYTQFHDDKCENGYFEVYDSDSEISILV